MPWAAKKEFRSTALPSLPTHHSCKNQILLVYKWQDMQSPLITKESIKSIPFNGPARNITVTIWRRILGADRKQYDSESQYN